MRGAGAALPDFPARVDAAGAAVVVADLRLRPATSRDLPLLREVYAGTRTAELAAVPWTQAMRAAFLDDQFALQHRHWLNRHPDAEYMVVERQGRPLGRCHVDFNRAAARGDALLIDLGLLPEACGQGIGSAVPDHLLRRCDRHEQAMRLHVLRANLGAQRLYRRFGFITETDEGAHLCLRRPACPARQRCEAAGASGTMDQLNSA